MFKTLLKILKDYFTKELFYLLFAIVFYIIYNQLSFNQNILNFTAKLFFKNNLNYDFINNYYKYILWFLSSFVYLFLFPFIFSSIIEGKNVFDKMGLKFKNKKIGFGIIIPPLILMIIIISIVVKIYPGFKTYYPFSKYALSALNLFIFYEICYFCYFISWEFFNHSFLLFPYVEKYGKSGAILIGLMPFVILHFGKPLPEVFGSIVAGIFLSILSLETKSFWYGMLLHGLVAVYMDIAVKIL